MWFFDPDTINAKKCKIAHIWRNHIFRFLIISLVIFDLQESTIPQIKAKDVSFGPYSLSFLAKINNLWERKQRSCLVFFPWLFEVKPVCHFIEIRKQYLNFSSSILQKNPSSPPSSSDAVCKKATEKYRMENKISLTIFMSNSAVSKWDFVQN